MFYKNLLNFIAKKSNYLYNKDLTAVQSNIFENAANNNVKKTDDIILLENTNDEGKIVDFICIKTIFS